MLTVKDFPHSKAIASSFVHQQVSHQCEQKCSYVSNCRRGGGDFLDKSQSIWTNLFSTPPLILLIFNSGYIETPTYFIPIMLQCKIAWSKKSLANYSNLLFHRTLHFELSMKLFENLETSFLYCQYAKHCRIINFNIYFPSPRSLLQRVNKKLQEH